MSCYHPLTCYRSIQGRDPKTGRWPIVFNRDQGYIDTELKVPCGQCIGCRLERSRQWAVRCVHESRTWDENSFITLTYGEKSLSSQCGVYDDTSDSVEEYSLNCKDFVLFIKRLRKKYASKTIRFFHCGEYGSKKGRPHHHALLFNHDFKDKVLSHVRNGEKLYDSRELEDIWTHGMCKVGDVTFKSAAYVARYITKKVTGKEADNYYDGIQPEYLTMSRRPGIGKYYYDKYGEDYRRTDKCIINGLPMKPPKYYDKIYDIMDPEGFKLTKYRREKEAKKVPEEERYFDRLEVKEKLKKKRIKTLQRSLEDEHRDVCSTR